MKIPNGDTGNSLGVITIIHVSVQTAALNI
jgi:hypothetical protein